jgi:hypothetical protein
VIGSKVMYPFHGVSRMPFAEDGQRLSEETRSRIMDLIGPAKTIEEQEAVEREMYGRALEAEWAAFKAKEEAPKDRPYVIGGGRYA